MLKNWNLFEKLLLAVNLLVGSTIFFITQNFGWSARYSN